MQTSKDFALRDRRIVSCSLSDHCPGHAILVELTDKVLSAFTREKLDIHETASLVRYAIRKGLIEP